jgi:hypothetical protein
VCVCAVSDRYSEGGQVNHKYLQNDSFKISCDLKSFRVHLPAPSV